MTRRAQIFFVLYVCVVAYLSLFPGDFLLHPRMDRLVWSPLTGRSTILDAVLNVLFYVPLGVAGVWSFRRKAVGWPVAVAAGIALSWLIEWLQLWSPVRYATLNDVAANGLGTILGATGAVLLGRPSWRGPRLPGSSAVLLILWFLWHGFPFAPRFTMLRLQQILHPLPWSWVSFGEALLGACVLGVALKDPRWWLVAFAVLPVQLTLLNHGLSYAVMGGAALGFAAVASLGNRAGKLLPWALTAWLIFAELRPFSFRPAVGFVWAPFSTWYQAGGSEQFYTILFGKLFLYTATVWSLEKRGLTWWRAAGIPGAILAVGEISQKWIVGRTPESTDVVLVAMGSILLRLAAPVGLEGRQLAVERQKSEVEGL